jgi:hypothetical protein
LAHNPDLDQAAQKAATRPALMWISLWLAIYPGGRITDAIRAIFTPLRFTGKLSDNQSKLHGRLVPRHA